jgi:hypothetical protein
MYFNIPVGHSDTQPLLNIESIPPVVLFVFYTHFVNFDYIINKEKKT